MALVEETWDILSIGDATYDLGDLQNKKLEELHCF